MDTISWMSNRQEPAHRGENPHAFGFITSLIQSKQIWAGFSSFDCDFCTCRY
jgi:hypothetical protein